MNQNKNPLGFIALGLLLAAILVPFIIVALGRDDLAIGFSTVAVLLALIIGAFSKSVRLGKAAGVGLLLFLAVVLAVAAVFIVIHAPAQRARLSEQSSAEQNRVIAMMNSHR